MTRARNPISSLVIAGFVAFAFSVAPVGLDDDFSLETKSAFAKGKGSGNSGGKGGSKRNSKSSSGDSDGFDDEEDGHSNSNGLGHVKAKGNGHNKDGAIESAHDDDDHDNHGSLASALGNLNAAHASPTALQHASRENSIVGFLALYAEDVAEYNSEMTEEQVMQAKQEALGLISNKSYFDDSLNDGDGAYAVDTGVVDAVDILLTDYSDTLSEETPD